jgi:hypothetical protein
MSDLITPEEMAGIVARAINRGLAFPIADHDDGGASITVAAPATGQLFTVTVTERTGGPS